GPKRSLPDDLVAFACLDFAATHHNTARVLSMTRLTEAPGSPGRVFQLNEAAITEALERFTERNAELEITRAAGIRQLIVEEENAADAHAIVDRLFGPPSRRRSHRVAA